MGVEIELQEALKEAMRAKDKAVLDVVRMLKAKGIEKKTSEGYHGGDLTEADWADIVASYAKQLQKSLVEFEKAGEAGRSAADKLRFEIDYCSRWMPKMLDEAQTRELVNAAIAEMGLRETKQLGQLMGRVTKEHKGKVDPALVKRVAEERLNQIAAGG